MDEFGVIRLSDKSKLPTRVPNQFATYDLYTPSQVTFQSQVTSFKRDIPLNLTFRVPKRFTGIITLHPMLSKTFHQFTKPVTHGMYHNVTIELICLSSYTIPKMSPIAQITFVKSPHVIPLKEIASTDTWEPESESESESESGSGSGEDSD